MPSKGPVTKNALGRFLAGRVPRADHVPDGDRFGDLLINLSHILHDAQTSVDVQWAAKRSWSRLHGTTAEPEVVWGQTLSEQVRVTGGLVLMAPVGPRWSDVPSSSWWVEIAPGETATSFFGAPARIDTVSIARALAAGRPLWLGWLAAAPQSIDGGLEPLSTITAGTPPDAVAREIARRCEPLLRTYPDQCCAVRRFWEEPFDPLTAPRIDRPSAPAQSV